MAPNNQRIGPPRMDPYERVLHRFYEPLFLLRELEPFERDYIQTKFKEGTMETIRRRFIKNLAYVCDSEKGDGLTTTAVSLAQSDGFVCFWIAQNGGVSKETQVFFAELLVMLGELAVIPPSDALLGSEELVRKYCLDFAKKRINKERTMLLSSLRSCDNHNVKGQEVFRLLKEKVEACTESVEICQIAFQVRHVVLRLTTSNNRSWLLSNESSKDGNIYHLSNVKHRIGRLAHHFRAIDELMEDARYQKSILDQCSLACVPLLPSISPLQKDNHTTIDGIVKRMLPRDDPNLEACKEKFSRLDQKFNTFKNISAYYVSNKWRPQVHCEVQMLEYFYNENLQYLEGDRYIGCSKLSCLCCRLYFRNHPARCVEPESHQKIYPNWSPPNLVSGAKDHQFKTQRSILYKMTVEIRDLAIAALNNKRSRRSGREDSLTQISSAMESFKIT